jgi:hypothetical protein
METADTAKGSLTVPRQTGMRDGAMDFSAISGHERRRSQQAPPVLYVTAHVLELYQAASGICESPS